MIEYRYRAGSSGRVAKLYTAREVDRKFERERQNQVIHASRIVTNSLSAVSTKTGSLTVTDTLTMGSGGVISWSGGQLTDSGIKLDLAGTYGSGSAIDWDGTGQNTLFALEASQNPSDGQMFLDAGAEFRQRIGGIQFLRTARSAVSISGNDAVEIKQLLHLDGVGAQLDNTQPITFKDSVGNLNNSISVDGADDMNLEVAGSNNLKLTSGGNTQVTGTLNADNIAGRLSASVQFDDKTVHNFATENLEMVDAGSSGATEQDWIEVTVGGNTGFIRVFASQ